MTRAAAVVAVVLTLGGCGHPAPPTVTAPPPAKSVQLNQPGQPVDLDASLVPGYVTVVDFWGEHCGACVVVSGMLAVQVAHEPRVLIRKIDVGDGFTEVAKAYKVNALPHYQVFDKQKRLRYVLTGNDCLQAPAIAKALAAE